EDLYRILVWRSNFNAVNTVPQVLNAYGVSTLEDLAWLQWGTGVVTNYTSIQVLDPSWNLAGIPEFGIWLRNTQGENWGFSVDQSKVLLNGTFGITSLAGAQALIAAVQMSDTATLQANWG